jgi:hypothetical protein
MKIALSCASRAGGKGGGRGFESLLEDEPTCAIDFASGGLYLPSPIPVILAWKYRRSHPRSACLAVVTGLSSLVRCRQSTLDEAKRAGAGSGAGHVLQRYHYAVALYQDNTSRIRSQRVCAIRYDHNTTQVHLQQIVGSP